MSGLVSVSDDTFDSEVIKSEVPVLVDFWAPWCGPCKALTPILESVATEIDAEKLVIKKINLDDNREIAAKFNVMNIPTLIIFKNGEPAATQIGGLNKKALSEFIDANI